MVAGRRGALPLLHHAAQARPRLFVSGGRAPRPRGRLHQPQEQALQVWAPLQRVQVQDARLVVMLHQRAQHCALLGAQGRQLGEGHLALVLGVSLPARQHAHGLQSVQPGNDLHVLTVHVLPDSLRLRHGAPGARGRADAVVALLLRRGPGSQRRSHHVGGPGRGAVRARPALVLCPPGEVMVAILQAAVVLGRVALLPVATLGVRARRSLQSRQ
mmetsp:Transcript_4452/g.11480  ORF Transcript_4452/g.11480 Transcript_4452/m.11480 type:complete len:215 (+) Transcript_4452:660-1304(+)